jgi:hypothetical protein
MHRLHRLVLCKSIVLARLNYISSLPSTQTVTLTCLLVTRLVTDTKDLLAGDNHIDRMLTASFMPEHGFSS